MVACVEFVKQHVMLAVEYQFPDAEPLAQFGIERRRHLEHPFLQPQRDIAEFEGILVDTGKVSEATVFGIPHPVKGSPIVCACAPMPDVDIARGVAEELSSAIVSGMGASYRPERIVFVDDLPRTRNLKIMRRVLRAVFENKDPGDLTALANPRPSNGCAKSSRRYEVRCPE